MHEARYPVPTELANVDQLMREADLEFAKYRRRADKRYGAVQLASIQGGFELLGHALDSVIDEYR